MSLTGTYNDKRCEELRKLFLLSLLRYAHGERHLQFRDLVDSWYAFHMKGGFVKKAGSGNIQWFNKGDLKEPRIWPLAFRMHFVSEAACNVMRCRVAFTDLIKDHAIPVDCLKAELCECKPATIEQVEEFLLARYRAGIITKFENKRLDAAKLRERMPTDDRSEFARYRCVLIKRCECPECCAPNRASDTSANVE